jgi:hypothetical protein
MIKMEKIVSGTSKNPTKIDDTKKLASYIIYLRKIYEMSEDIYDQKYKDILNFYDAVYYWGYSGLANTQRFPSPREFVLILIIKIVDPQISFQ